MNNEETVRNPHRTPGWGESGGFFGKRIVPRGAIVALASLAMGTALGCGVFKPPVPMAPDPDVETPPVVADVVVAAQVTPLDDGFRYSYSVTNNTDVDLVIISIAVPGEPSAVTNVMSPAGFQAVFDPDFGVIDFIMDAGEFPGGSTVGGFGFDSPFDSGPADFTALDLNGDMVIGTTQAPAL